MLFTSQEQRLQRALNKIFINGLGLYDYSRLSVEEYSLVLDSSLVVVNH